MDCNTVDRRLLPEIAGAHAQLLEAIERGDVAAALSTLPPYLERAAESRRGISKRRPNSVMK